MGMTATHGAVIHTRFLACIVFSFPALMTVLLAPAAGRATHSHRQSHHALADTESARVKRFLVLHARMVFISTPERRRYVAGTFFLTDLFGRSMLNNESETQSHCN